MFVEEKKKQIELLEEIRNLLREIRNLSRHLVAESQSTTARLRTNQVTINNFTGRRHTMATQAILTFTLPDGITPNTPPAGDGSGIDVTFASDNPAVTLGAATASGDTATAMITGTDAFNLSAVVANTSGAPLLDNDGVTPFIQPSPIAVAASTPPPLQTTTAVLSTE